MRLRTIVILALFTFTASHAYAEISIMCSMFPVYDFTRNITGGLANVKLLMRPGIDPHDYEPSPMDIKALNDSDMFIFTGGNMEHWAGDISRSLPHTLIIDASQNIPLTDNDPHIWLDLSLAQRMVMNILRGLCEVDPDNAQEYTRNADTFCAELGELDGAFMDMRKDKALVFAGEFSAGCFMRHYGFEYVSAYDGENEPSVMRMASTLKYIREHKTRYIFTDYGGITDVTRAISDETGAEILTFGTGHVMPDDDMTFLEVMRENYRNISEAMND